MGGIHGKTSEEVDVTAFTVSVRRTPSAIRPAIVSAACLLLWASAITQGASPDYVTVNFATDKGPVTYRANGLLHPFAKNFPACYGTQQPLQTGAATCALLDSMEYTRPPASLVDPLKIRMVRVGWSWNPKAYERARSLGADVQIVLSDLYYGAGNFYTYAVDTTKWRTFVTDFARLAKEKNWKLQWDLWNEPLPDGTWERHRGAVS